MRQKGPIAPKWTYTPRHGPLGQRPEFRVRICLDRPKKDPLDRKPPVKFPLNKLQVGRWVYSGQKVTGPRNSVRW